MCLQGWHRGLRSWAVGSRLPEVGGKHGGQVAGPAGTGAVPSAVRGGGIRLFRFFWFCFCFFFIKIVLARRSWLVMISAPQNSL